MRRAPRDCLRTRPTRGSQWGITKTRDIGELVFNMVEEEIMIKEDSDNREDFDDVYDFSEVFEKDFELDIES